MTHRRSRLSTIIPVLSLLAAVMAICVGVFGVPWVIAVAVATSILGAGIVIGGTAAWVSDQVQLRRHKDEVSMDALMDRVDKAANRYHADNHQHEDES
jgi:UPF0716 family protein affecting phage T7 exclusion